MTVCKQRSLNYLGVVVWLALATTFAFNTASAADYLNGEEIKELLSGNTLEGPGDWRMYYDPSGQTRGQEGSITDTGKWEVLDDRYCIRWNNWVDGKRMCWKVKRKGKRINRVGIDGTGSSKVTINEGNPAGL